MEADTEPAGPPLAGESSPEERSTWARLLSQVYEVDPLTCPRCGGRVKVIAFIQAPGLVDRLLRHVRGR